MYFFPSKKTDAIVSGKPLSTQLKKLFMELVNEKFKEVKKNLITSSDKENKNNSKSPLNNTKIQTPKNIVQSNKTPNRTPGRTPKGILDRTPNRTSDGYPPGRTPGQTPGRTPGQTTDEVQCEHCGGMLPTSLILIHRGICKGSSKGSKKKTPTPTTTTTKVRKLDNGSSKTPLSNTTTPSGGWLSTTTTTIDDLPLSSTPNRTTEQPEQKQTHSNRNRLCFDLGDIDEDTPRGRKRARTQVESPRSKQRPQPKQQPPQPKQPKPQLNHQKTQPKPQQQQQQPNQRSEKKENKVRNIAPKSKSAVSVGNTPTERTAATTTTTRPATTRPATTTTTTTATRPLPKSSNNSTHTENTNTNNTSTRPTIEVLDLTDDDVLAVTDDDITEVQTSSIPTSTSVVDVDNSSECPMCFKRFPQKRIMVHAAMCDGNATTSRDVDSSDSDSSDDELPDVGGGGGVGGGVGSVDTGNGTAGQVPCPICGSSIPQTIIEIHVNACLDGG